jgi:predicted CopG family antitoxin
MPTVKVKTIKITPEAHKMLGRAGRKDETFSDVIKRVLEHYEKCTKK